MLKEHNTNYWLKQNGLNPKTFVEDPLYISQAVMVAKNLLQHHGRLLDHTQAQTLNKFISSKSKKVTYGQCIKVMNIGKSINRKVFKQYKALNKR